jgi:mannose-1-phosphate guanylyltransferase
LTDMIVVDAGDAILVCPKSRAQEVKHLVEALKKNHKLKYL